MENKIELVCPECNEKFNVDIFTSINVQMDKDMKNRVLSGKLFDMRSEERRVGKEGRTRWSAYH